MSDGLHHARRTVGHARVAQDTGATPVRAHTIRGSTNSNAALAQVSTSSHAEGGTNCSTSRASSSCSDARNSRALGQKDIFSFFDDLQRNNWQGSRVWDAQKKTPCVPNPISSQKEREHTRETSGRRRLKGGETQKPKMVEEPTPFWLGGDGRNSRRANRCYPG